MVHSGLRFGCRFGSTPCLHAVRTKSVDTLTALLEINDFTPRFQVDTGAEVNTICQWYVRKEQVTSTNKNLIMWNKSNVNSIGETMIKVTNPKTQLVHDVKFIVVKK